MRLPTVALLALALAAGCGPEPEPLLPALGDWAEPAPVIFVLVDTLRADHTSISGHRAGRDTTPFLRELAEQSFVFERAYVHASWTRASMATMFSSRLPSSHGCETRHGVMVDEVLTWPEVLQENGWHTRAVVTNGNVDASYGFDQGFDVFDHRSDWPRNAYADAWLVREPVLGAVDRTGDRLGALWLHYVDPHDPYRPHDDASYLRQEVSGVGESVMRLREIDFDRPEDPEVVEEILDLYDGEVLWWDRQLETLFERLDDRGWLDESWIVLTSDHGEGLWDHTIRAHGQEIFEEQLLVPFLLRPPGGLPERVSVDPPFGMIDLGPTLLDLLGQPVPEEFEGRSWAPALRGREDPPVRPVIIEERLDHIELLGVVDDQDKLIVTRRKFGGSVELYDLATNPGEDPALAIDLREQRTSTGTRLQRLLDDAVRAARERRPADTQTGLRDATPEQIAQLKALGYLGDGPPDDDPEDN